MAGVTFLGEATAATVVAPALNHAAIMIGGGDRNGGTAAWSGGACGGEM